MTRDWDWTTISYCDDGKTNRDNDLRKLLTPIVVQIICQVIQLLNTFDLDHLRIFFLGISLTVAASLQIMMTFYCLCACTLHQNTRISDGRSDVKSGYSDRQFDAKKL